MFSKTTEPFESKLVPWMVLHKMHGYIFMCWFRIKDDFHERHCLSYGKLLKSYISESTNLIELKLYRWSSLHFSYVDLNQRWPLPQHKVEQRNDEKVVSFLNLLNYLKSNFAWMFLHPCLAFHVDQTLKILVTAGKCFITYATCKKQRIFGQVTGSVEPLALHFELTLPKAMWAFAITWHPSSVNFSHFNLLLWNPSAKWTETW